MFDLGLKKNTYFYYLLIFSFGMLPMDVSYSSDFKGNVDIINYLTTKFDFKKKILKRLHRCGVPCKGSMCSLVSDCNVYYKVKNVEFSVIKDININDLIKPKSMTRIQEDSFTVENCGSTPYYFEDKVTVTYTNTVSSQLSKKYSNIKERSFFLEWKSFMKNTIGGINGGNRFKETLSISVSKGKSNIIKTDIRMERPVKIKVQAGKRQLITSKYEVKKIISAFNIIAVVDADLYEQGYLDNGEEASGRSHSRKIGKLSSIYPEEQRIINIDGTIIVNGIGRKIHVKVGTEVDMSKEECDEL